MKRRIRNEKILGSGNFVENRGYLKFSLMSLEYDFIIIFKINFIIRLRYLEATCNEQSKCKC